MPPHSSTTGHDDVPRGATVDPSAGGDRTINPYAPSETEADDDILRWTGTRRRRRLGMVAVGLIGVAVTVVFYFRNLANPTACSDFAAEVCSDMEPNLIACRERLAATLSSKLPARECEAALHDLRAALRMAPDDQKPRLKAIFLQQLMGV